MRTRNHSQKRPRPSAARRVDGSGAQDSGAVFATVVLQALKFVRQAPVGPYYRRFRLPSLQARRRGRWIAACRQRLRRQTRRMALVALGYRVLRFWNRGRAAVDRRVCCETIVAAVEGRLAPFERFKRPTTEDGACPSSGACAGHLLPAKRGEGTSMIRLEPRFAELAATTNFSFLRGASHPEEMVARAAGARARRHRDRRPQHARRRRARACLRAREQGGDGGHARRSRRAARLRRRNAGHPRLSEGPRGLRPALPDPHRGKPARAEGRVPAAARGSPGARRGPAGRGAAPHPALRDSQRRGARRLSRKGRRSARLSTGYAGEGRG